METAELVEYKTNILHPTTIAHYFKIEVGRKTSKILSFNGRKAISHGIHFSVGGNKVLARPIMVKIGETVFTGKEIMSMYTPDPYGSCDLHFFGWPVKQLAIEILKGDVFEFEQEDESIINAYVFLKEIHK